MRRFLERHGMIVVKPNWPCPKCGEDRAYIETNSGHRDNVVLSHFPMSAWEWAQFLIIRPFCAWAQFKRRVFGL